MPKESTRRGTLRGAFRVNNNNHCFTEAIHHQGDDASPLRPTAALRRSPPTPSSPVDSAAAKPTNSMANQGVFFCQYLRTLLNKIENV
jgi:hypothetical protein